MTGRAMTPGAPEGRRRRLELLAVLAWVALGVGLRAWRLGQPALFRDEAESCINAMAILREGLPTDRHLGQPIFENTLVRPWPESVEFEFRDVSYSPRGLAIYHGWLPLYAIAASLAVAGIEPDVGPRPPRDGPGLEALARAARAPSILFSAAFLLLVHLAGRALGGPPAGLVALSLAAVLPQAVWFGSQARYYAAGLALTAAALGAGWRLARRGARRDHVLAAVLLALAFHTSLIACAAAALVLGPLSLVAAVRRRERAGPAWAAALLLLASVPWALASGFLGTATEIPAAWRLLDFPADHLLYLRVRWWMSVGALLVAVELALAGRLPARLGDPLRAARGPLGYLASWFVGSYLAFLLLVPAPSFFLSRLTLLLLAPAVLFAGVVVAAHLRALPPRAATPGAALVTLAALGIVPFLPERGRDEDARALPEVADFLRERELGADERLYALPLQHLPLTLAAGRVVQSVAPVRRSFLEAHPGRVWIVESLFPGPRLGWRGVRRRAAQEGLTLTEDEARAWRRRVLRTLARRDLEGRVASIATPPEELPAWARALVGELLEARRRGARDRDYRLDNPAVFDERHPAGDDAEFWPTFFYRFVDPAARSGERVCYAERAREARAWILPCAWVVLECPARSAGR